MSEIPVLITARLASTRLPRKHLLDLGEGYTVIEHIYLRCKHFGLEPILCLPIGEQWPSGAVEMKAFGGDPVNVEERLMACAAANNLTKFHHLDGDDPFFDPYMIFSAFNTIKDHRIMRAMLESRCGSAVCGDQYNLNGTGEVNSMSDKKDIWPQRLTLDYIEDYHLLLAVNRMVGGYMAPRPAVDELFIRNPDLHKINWFRTAEWKARQLAEKSTS